MGDSLVLQTVCLMTVILHPTSVTIVTGTDDSCLHWSEWEPRQSCQWVDPPCLILPLNIQKPITIDKGKCRAVVSRRCLRTNATNVVNNTHHICSCYSRRKLTAYWKVPESNPIVCEAKDCPLANMWLAWTQWSTWNDSGCIPAARVRTRTCLEVPLFFNSDRNFKSCLGNLYETTAVQKSLQQTTSASCLLLNQQRRRQQELHSQRKNNTFWNHYGFYIVIAVISTGCLAAVTMAIYRLAQQRPAGNTCCPPVNLCFDRQRRRRIGRARLHMILANQQASSGPGEAAGRGGCLPPPTYEEVMCRDLNGDGDDDSDFDEKSVSSIPLPSYDTVMRNHDHFIA